MPRWCVEPGPALPNVTVPGAAFALATTSASVLNSELAGTTTKNGMVMMLEIQSKLFTVSNGSDLNIAPKIAWPPGVTSSV